MKVYILKIDGYTGSWGTKNYLVGVYDSEEKAKEAMADLPLYFKKREAAVKLFETELNETLEITRKQQYEGFRTDICLGSYVE